MNCRYELVDYWAPAAPDVTRPPMPEPKLQTIRALRKGRARHARPGENVQLYCGLRAPGALRIGEARCIDVQPIYIEVEGPLVRVGAGVGFNYRRLDELDEFARADGFADWKEMALFWYEEHHADMNDFNGVIIMWRPLT